MRVRLKGLNVVRVRLADGTHAEYFYAWKGGPRLNAELGARIYCGLPCSRERTESAAAGQSSDPP
jgi:hypothetical protein